MAKVCVRILVFGTFLIVPFLMGTSCNLTTKARPSEGFSGDELAGYIFRPDRAFASLLPEDPVTTARDYRFRGSIGAFEELPDGELPTVVFFAEASEEEYDRIVATTLSANHEYVTLGGTSQCLGQATVNADGSFLFEISTGSVNEEYIFAFGPSSLGGPDANPCEGFTLTKPGVPPEGGYVRESVISTLAPDSEVEFNAIHGL